ncbi:MAG: (Fe-S)-binding protein [Chromatiales bacterium]|nr:(Fe-S)-binding protein [Chromatiales bacterium]
MRAQVDFEAYMAREIRDLSSACTSCGRCVEVCPVTKEAGVDPQSGPTIVRDLFNSLERGESLSADSSSWMNHCNGCGECIPACPESINPRRLLMFAQCHDAQDGAGVDQVFRKLAQAVRLIAAMQLQPEDMSRVFNHRAVGKTDVVFYTGCNALRTPHVLLNAMQILDSLDVNYQVAGGPASCCGIAHTRTEGNVAIGGQVMDSTVVRFEAMGAKRVLSWCPSCQSQMDETWNGYRERSFSLEHITQYLMEHADELKARWRKPLPRRVLVHAHSGYAEFGQHVADLLSSIPHLEVVDTVVESGYTCGVAGSARAPKLNATDRGRLINKTSDEGIDAVVSLYHSCHRSLLADQDALDAPVVNFTDLIVEALGGDPAPDRFAHLSRLSSADVMNETKDFLAANGVSVDAQWFDENLEDLFSMAEYRGGLECFAQARG